jgi:predicted transcriptional regulator of viral defense system
MMREYGSNKEHDFSKLIRVAREAANGAAWKRLGYLAELLWPGEKGIVTDAFKHVTTGYVALDPTVRKKGTILRRWGLRVNVGLERLSDS